MHLNIVFSVFCCILFANAVALNENDSKIQNLFEKTDSSYEKFIKSPQPSLVLISSRDLPEIKAINARRVSPMGVVVQRCPKKIGFKGNEKRCRAIQFQEEEMVVKVFLVTRGDLKTVLVKHETSCEC